MILTHLVPVFSLILLGVVLAGGLAHAFTARGTLGLADLSEEDLAEIRNRCPARRVSGSRRT